jgi:NTP pyrophosphatase (non-canonical NTP hydrolase)
MNLNERVDEALIDTRSWFPHLEGDIQHFLISMAGEAGETCNAYKKWDRVVDPDESLTRWPETKAQMGGELVDVLVYLFCLAGELNVDLEEEYDRKRAFNIERFGQPGSAEAVEAGNA